MQYSSSQNLKTLQTCYFLYVKNITGATFNLFLIIDTNDTFHSIANFRWRQWVSSLPGLRKFDPSAQPPVNTREIFGRGWCKKMEKISDQIYRHFRGF